MSESGGEGSMAVVPSDTLGRLRSSPEQRTALLAEYKRSGMTAAAFARWSGIKYPTFMAWVAKARRGQNRQSEQAAQEGIGLKPMRWAEVVCEGPVSASRESLVIELNGGLRVETTSPALAAQFIAALGGATC
jgi:transposase-like protein